MRGHALQLQLPRLLYLVAWLTHLENQCAIYQHTTFSKCDTARRGKLLATIGSSIARHKVVWGVDSASRLSVENTSALLPYSGAAAVGVKRSSCSKFERGSTSGFNVASSSSSPAAPARCGPCVDFGTATLAVMCGGELPPSHPFES